MSDHPPEICSCSALRQAARHVTRLYDMALAPTGLGLNQYAVLSKLDRFGAQILQDLADRLVMDRSSLGHLLRPLQDRNLVQIAVSKTDRRQRLISLTPDGTDLFHQARPRWAKAEQRFETTFGVERSLDLRVELKQVTSLEFSA